jgi:hypothetical protein
MKIINETLISTVLIKKVMRLAQVQREDATLIISHDDSDTDNYGHYSSWRMPDDSLVHVINVAREGDIITLGHELRHLAQCQLLGAVKYNNTATQILENDAEAFERYLIKKGY